MKTMEEELFDNLRLELRRGYLIVAVLAQLRAEHYGYALRKALADRGMEIDENTLYPLLRRLESQGLLVSSLARREQAQQAFLPALGRGRDHPARLLEEWRAIDDALSRISATSHSHDVEQ